MLRTSYIDKKLIHIFLRNVDISGRSGLAAANGGIAFTFFANFFFSLRCTIHINMDSKPLEPVCCKKRQKSPNQEPSGRSE